MEQKSIKTICHSFSTSMLPSTNLSPMVFPPRLWCSSRNRTRSVPLGSMPTIPLPPFINYRLCSLNPPAPAFYVLHLSSASWQMQGFFPTQKTFPRRTSDLSSAPNRVHPDGAKCFPATIFASFGSLPILKKQSSTFGRWLQKKLYLLYGSALKTIFARNIHCRTCFHFRAVAPH